MSVSVSIKIKVSNGSIKVSINVNFLFSLSVIQFGFITIFVAAFPLAPFFALANNIFEIRIDSNKLICETRRPIADRAQDLGIWFNILDAVAKIAVISNVRKLLPLSDTFQFWLSIKTYMHLILLNIIVYLLSRAKL